MDPALKLNLIRTAQRYAVDNPRDFAHDVAHLHSVWLEASDIAENISEPVNRDILQIICWWHDIILPQTDSDHVEAKQNISSFLANNFAGSDKEIIIDSIMNHEFGSKPNFIEGKILYDADKLNVLSIERLELSNDAVLAGYMPKEEAKRILTVLLSDWLPNMPKMYHFDYSRELHLQRVDAVKQKMEELVKIYER